MTLPFRVVSLDENLRWPSGHYDTIAVLDISPEELERRVGAQLTTGLEEGLGTWRGVGLELRSGAPVEIIRYEDAPELGPFYLRGDANANTASVCDEALAALALQPSVALWTLKKDLEEPHQSSE